MSKKRGSPNKLRPLTHAERNKPARLRHRVRRLQRAINKRLQDG